MTTILAGAIGLLAFFLYPDKIGRVVGFVVFAVAVLAFWTNLIFNGV